MNGRYLFLYSDILFDPSILEKLLKSNGDISIVVDRAWNDQKERDTQTNGGTPDLVITNQPPETGYRYIPSGETANLEKIGQHISPVDANGEFVGMAMFSPGGSDILKDIYKDLRKRDPLAPFQQASDLRKANFTDVLQELIDRGTQISCIDVYKGWLEIDTFEDYRRAWAKLQ